MPEDEIAAVPSAPPIDQSERPGDVNHPTGEHLLRFNGVNTSYGQIQVLHNVDYVVNQGEIVALLGSNGAGKTTTMKAIMGIVRPTKGSIDFGLRRIDTISTAAIVRAGIAPVPEGRRVFGRLSVEDNLRMGAYVRTDKDIGGDIARVYELFPRLQERRHQTAGTMSGGEQQMLAIGRALMARPKLMIMDEPSMGLSPIFVERVFDTIQTINKQGTTIFMVEQNAFMALSIAHRGYVLRSGRVVLQGTSQELLNSEGVRREYMGGV